MPTWRVSDAPTEVTVEVVTEALSAALDRYESAHLAIPGGSVMKALSPLRIALGKNWSRVKLTWVDERCVSFDHPDSNRGEAYRTKGLSRESPCAFELPLYTDDEHPETSVVRVAHGLAEHFDGRIDVALLGMGGDGHIASLFHGVSLDGTDPEHRVGWISRSPKPPSVRVTLTRTTIENASTKVLLAAGTSKRDALERLKNGDETVSAWGLHGLVVVTDQRV